jgi:PAS domain S-box-containing protein
MLTGQATADQDHEHSPGAGAAPIYANGEMADRIRRFPWETTALDAISKWSETLLCAVNMMLESQFPMLLLWGPEMVVLYNDACIPLEGDKHPDVLGKTGPNCWPEAWHILEPKLTSVLEHGARLYFENELIPIHRQGSLTDVYWTYSYSPIRDAAGAVCGILVVSHDVTARLHAERERDAMAANLKNVLESTTDGLVVLDQRARYTYVNEQAARLVGMKPADMIGKSQWELFPLAATTEFGAEYRKAVETGKPHHFDNFYPEPLNAWFECHCYPSEHGVSIYFREVTEQKQAERELREREELFHVLADSLPQLIWMTDGRGENIYCNQRYFDYLGVTEADRANIPWLELVHPDDLATTLTIWKHSVETGDPYSNEFRLRRKDGMFRYLLARAVPIRNDHGKIERWIGSLTDIHDQKLAEDALRKSEKLATAGRLAASIAHEINNPLEGVTNALYLALQDDSLPAETKTYLEMAEQELRRVGHITTQTLRFHKQSISPTPTDICDIVDSVLALFERRLATKNIQVKAECERGSIATCLADELRQVMANLISNAMDAMPQGGALRVRVKRTRSCAPEREQGVTIVIADSGHGIPHEVLERIFEPFVSTKETTGIGLGLWVSEGIVRKHGGTIRVRSSVSLPEARPSGTVFTVFIPSAAMNE